MALIRRQNAITAVSPHNANKRYLVPRRSSGHVIPPEWTEGGIVIEITPANCFEDDAGTTPATLDGPVGLVKGREEGHDISQSVLGSKPILRFVDGRYCLEFNGISTAMTTTGDATGGDAMSFAAGIMNRSDNSADHIFFSCEPLTNSILCNAYAPRTAGQDNVAATWRFGGTATRIMRVDEQKPNSYLHVIGRNGKTNTTAQSHLESNLRPADLSQGADQGSTDIANATWAIGMRANGNTLFEGYLFCIAAAGQRWTDAQIGILRRWIAQWTPVDAPAPITKPQVGAVAYSGLGNAITYAAAATVDKPTIYWFYGSIGSANFYDLVEFDMDGPKNNRNRMLVRDDFSFRFVTEGSNNQTPAVDGTGDVVAFGCCTATSRQSVVYPQAVTGDALFTTGAATIPQLIADQALTMGAAFQGGFKRLGCAVGGAMDISGSFDAIVAAVMNPDPTVLHGMLPAEAVLSIDQCGTAEDWNTQNGWGELVGTGVVSGTYTDTPQVFVEQLPAFTDGPSGVLVWHSVARSLVWLRFLVWDGSSYVAEEYLASGPRPTGLRVKTVAGDRILLKAQWDRIAAWALSL